MTQSEIHRCESNHFRMVKVKKDFQTCFIVHLLLGGLAYGMAFIVGVISTASCPNQRATVFSQSLSSGFFQIFLGILFALSGWLTALRIRIVTFCMMVIEILLCIAIFTSANNIYSAGNLLLLFAGIATDLWIQKAFIEDNLLKEEPGYPVFSANAAHPARYEAPLTVTGRQPSNDMQDIRMPEPAKAQTPAGESRQPSPLPPAKDVLLPPEVKLKPFPDSESQLESIFRQSVSPQPRPAAVPENVTLSQIQAESSRQQAPQEPVPTDCILADMNAIPSHSVARPKPELLPDPNEVRARLAQMKRAREAAEASNLPE